MIARRVSLVQMAQIAAALGSYARDEGVRPRSLAALGPRLERLESDLSTQDGLGRLTLQDVLYQSGLHGDDPGDLVLLYCVFPDGVTGTYIVSRNDGRTEVVTAAELVARINRTNEYLASLTASERRQAPP